MLPGRAQVHHAAGEVSLVGVEVGGDPGRLSGWLGGEPAVTGLLNRQVLNWHAEDRKARYTGKTVPSPNRNQDHPATANFRSDTPQGPCTSMTSMPSVAW